MKYSDLSMRVNYFLIYYLWILY